MHVSRCGTRIAARSCVPYLLAASLLTGLTPLSAQEPVRDSASSPSPIVLVVRDATTGHPLEAAGVVLERRGAAPTVLGYTNSAGRVAIQPTTVTSRVAVRAPEGVLRIQRIGYVVRSVTLAELAAHSSEHPSAVHEVALTPQPALLSAIAVEASSPNQLATGTALAIATVDGDDVRNRPATSLGEALVAVEGVTTSRIGAWGSKVSVRGLGGERLAYMIDGARVNRACNFGMDQGLATIDPATVERVELLAGPGSTLYGSGNVGGVLNVVTRNPALAAPDGRVGGEVRAGASTAVPGGTAGFGLWTRRGRFDIALQADAQRYGDYRTPDARIDGSSFRAATADLKAGLSLTAAQRLAFQYTEYAARDIGWPAMAGTTIPAEGRRTFALDWGWQRGHGLIDAASARAYVQRLDHHMVMAMDMPMSSSGGTSTAAMPMRSTTDAQSYSTTSGGRAQLRMRPDDRSQVDAGIEATQWAAEGTRWVTTSQSSGSMAATTTYHTWPQVRILDLGVFAQGERQVIDRLTLSGGARADRIDKRADGWPSADEVLGTGNIGARFALGSGFGLRMSAGLGYRVPDPTELFGVAVRPDGFVYRGNPDLSTERGRTLEAGLGWDGAVHALLVHEASVSLTAFRNDLRDLITPALITGDSIGGKPVREYVNVAEARLSGVTAALAADIAPAFRLRGSATMTRGEDLTTGAALAAVSPLTVVASLRFAPNEHAGVLPAMARVTGWVEVEGRGATRQTRAASQAGERITPGWNAVAVRAGAMLAGVSLGVGVENLFDRSYREHLDPASLMRPGRNLSIRMSRGF